MSASLAAFVVANRAASPAAHFGRLGRLAAAGTLVVGATFQVIAFALIPDHDETLDRFRWIADHPTQSQISKTFDLLAVPRLIGGAIIYVLLARQRAPRLAWTGGILLGLAIARAAARRSAAPRRVLHRGRAALAAADRSRDRAGRGLWIASTILRAREEPA